MPVRSEVRQREQIESEGVSKNGGKVIWSEQMAERKSTWSGSPLRGVDALIGDEEQTGKTRRNKKKETMAVRGIHIE